MTLVNWFQRYQKLFFYFMLTVMATQLIYFNTSLGYSHLILYLLTFLTVDLFRNEYRNFKLEIVVNSFYLATPVLLIAHFFVGDIMKWVYIPVVIGLIYYNFYIINQVRVIAKKKELFKVSERNKVLFTKNPNFIKFYSITIMAILTGMMILSIIDLF